VFIDDKPVQVDPGCTVLQVIHFYLHLLDAVQIIWLIIHHHKDWQTFFDEGQTHTRLTAL